MRKLISLCLPLCALLAALPAFAQDNQTLKVAPADAAVIAHIDGKAVGSFLAKFQTQMFKSAAQHAGSESQPATDSFMKIAETKIAQTNQLAAKIDSVDVYVSAPMPMPLIVVYTKLTPKEILEQFARLYDINDVTVQENSGQYSFVSKSASQPAEGENAPRDQIKMRSRMYAPPIVALDAKAAIDLTQDAVVIGITNMLPEQLGQYQAGVSDEIKALATKVDISAPIWGVFNRGSMKLPKDAPTIVYGSIYLDGSKESKLVFTFADAQSAGGFSSSFLDSRKLQRMPFVPGMFKVTAQDCDVTFTSTVDEAWGQKAMASLQRARMLALRASSAANLSFIGKGIAIYMASNNDTRRPSGFAELIKEGNIPANVLISPSSGRQFDPKEGANTKPDYVFIELPADADAKLINVYEPAEINGGEGGNVLFANHIVRWLSADELKAAVAKTRQALGQEE